MDFEKPEEEFSQIKDDPLAFIRYFERNSDLSETLDDSDEEQKRPTLVQLSR